MTTAVTPVADGTWQVDVSGDLDQAAQTLAATLIGGGHSLFELRLMQRDLETVFREVNEEARDAA